MRSIQQNKEDIFQAKEKEFVDKVCYNPENPIFWIELANLYANAGYHEFARTYYREALKLLEAKCSLLK